MVNNFDCLMSEKTMQRICFVYTKIRCASLATKIFKNIGILFKTISTTLQTISTMQEYCLKTIYINLSSIIVNSWIYLVLMLHYIQASPDKCLIHKPFKQDLTAPVLSISLALILRLRAAPNRFQCSSRTILDVLRTFQWIYLPLVEFTMFSELTIGFDSRYMYRSCICLWHLRQNTASGSNVQGIVPRMIIL